MSKLKLTPKELTFLKVLIGYTLTSSIENSSSTNNGSDEDVEHAKNNPHEITALEKMSRFLTALTPATKEK